MWEILKSTPPSQLRRFFGQLVNGRWAFIDPGTTVELQMFVDRQFHEFVDRGDFRLILAKMLQNLTNKMLSNASSRALLWEPNGGSFQLKFVPHNLIGFLWAQFSEAVAGGKKFRQCASCTRWMEIAPGQGRPEKNYCSDACRMRAYRKRKATKVQGKSRPRKADL
jgi:hypothetical protein